MASKQRISDTLHVFRNADNCNVVALHGKETSGGDFLVEDLLEAGLPPQSDLPNNSGEDKYVVLVSGLNVGSSSSNPLQLQLLVDHITGHLGDEKEQRSAAQIVQVVVAGNSVQIQHGLLNGQNLASKDQSKLSEPIKELDMFLTQIAAGIPIDIMAGYNDPANFALPQQPLNRCLFPGSSSYNTFRSCTNPHLFDVDNVRFLGTSGQNIDDLGKYSKAEDTLEFLERTLRWRHLAPTAPNTLGCYPFTDRDPFFIESCPHVYFVGNQDKYATRILKGSEGQVVRLICVPKFSETGVAVMVSLISKLATNCIGEPEKSGVSHSQFRDSNQLITTYQVKDKSTLWTPCAGRCYDLQVKDKSTLRKRQSTELTRAHLTVTGQMSEQGKGLSYSKNHKSPTAGPTPDPVTPVNLFARNDDNPNNLPSLQDQILDHMFSLKALIKHHNEKSGTLMEPIRLTFDDEEEGDKAKACSKGTEEEKEEDLQKPYKEVLKSPFTRRIIEFSAPNHRMPTNLKIYDGFTDPDDHVTRFVRAANQGEWQMLLWCRMF
ncbi:DNA polymerase delta small subunit [Tanacetum coccineum]